MTKKELVNLLKKNLKISIYDAGDLYVEIYFGDTLICEDSVELDYIRR